MAVTNTASVTNTVAVTNKVPVSNKGQRYAAQDIEVLEGLEPVRKRPGMYIAGTDTPAGLHQLVFEILDNSVDEAMNGHASEIEVILHKDSQSVTVTDNGRGIPVDEHPKYKRSALELILTTLHAGGKFSDANYKTAGGLHGVGSSVVNALSSELIATIRRDGKEYEQKFSRGKPLDKLKVLKNSLKGSGVAGTGTKIFFRPDDQIFATTTFTAKLIRSSMQTKAYLNPGLSLTFTDETRGTTERFFYEDGLVSYLKQLLEESKSSVIGEEPFVIVRKGDVEVTVAVAWTEHPREEWHCFANGIPNPDGGSHEQGAKAGIVKAVRNYMNVHDVQLKGLKVGAEDIREGLIGIVSVKLAGGAYQAQFQGQTKGRLNNPEIAPIVEAAVRTLEQTLNSRPSAANAIVNRVMLAARARAASRQAVETVRRKIGISHRLTLPGKLADCSSTKPSDCELFIVEGDSAGGSTKQGRDRHYQAVLPLRGKVLNTVAASQKKTLDNKELADIVSALGAGAAEGFRLEKLRYGKIIILTDADADGMHIATLLMAFFFQTMRPLIEGGFLYLGKPPLYGIFSQSRGKPISKVKTAKKKESEGPSGLFAYSDEELNEVIAKNKLTSPRITRYKGLGEMNPSTLWETTLDPDTRTLLKLRVEDEAAVIAAFHDLMGPDPSRRYKLIQERADSVELDI